MRWLRPFLAASAVSWVGLGVAGLVVPEALLGIAGVAARTPSAVVELRATYGGLPMAVGVLAAAGFFRGSLVRPALFTLAYLNAGLFMARLLGSLIALELNDVTAVALLFEILSTVFAVRLLDLHRSAESP